MPKNKTGCCWTKQVLRWREILKKDWLFRTNKNHIAYVDGVLDGKKGGVGILRIRTEDGELCAVFKYSAQGMGHGHFDKLSYSLYDELGKLFRIMALPVG
ncbi:MAG: heparinase II/III family protein [Lewinellaceae bacterium]|nr:heparinase II/III family protein [Lewinellaceae bacterium]